MHPLNPDIPDSFPSRAVFARPAVRIFLAIAAGIVIAQATEYQLGGWMLAAAGALALTGTVLISRGSSAVKWSGPLLLIALALLSSGWTIARVAHAPADSLIHLLDDEPAILRVQAFVIGQPRASTPSGALAASARYAPPSVRMRLEVRRMQRIGGDWAPATGKLYAAISGVQSVDFNAGDLVQLTGMASRLKKPGNPGAHDPHPSAMQHGIVGSLRVSDPALVSVIDARGGVFAAAARVRAGMLDSIESAGDRAGRSGSAALLGALLLGERDSSALAELEESFTRTGVGHFLAISGLHVGMVLVGLALLVRLTGDRPRLEFAVVLAASLLLIVLIPARPPVLRAVIIALAFLAAQASGRSYDRLSILALVAAALLIARPIDLFNPGFQLTFLVVAGLIVCVQPLRIWLFGARPATDELHGWAVAEHRLKDAAAVSLCASAISTPLIALHFGVFSALSAPLSILFSPLVALVLGLGYAALAIGAMLPASSEALISVALLPAAWLSDAVAWFDALPGVAIYLPSMSWLLASGLIAVAFWWMFPSYTSERRRWLATGAALLPIAYGVLIGPSIGRNQALRVDMLDVGDGTTILLRSGREAVLYDCGSRWLAIGEREIPRAVRALGAGRVSTVIVSHADIDHFSGLIDAARPLGVRRVLVPPQFTRQAEQDPEGAPALLLRRLAGLGITVDTVSRGDTILLGSVNLEVLHPEGAEEFGRDNDASVVLWAAPMGNDRPPRVLLVGDIERDAMALLESRGPELRAEIVEVPHHGSARAFAYPFVDALEPQVLLQSTGPSRLMDERWDEVRAGREWWTTASDGAVTIIIRRDGTMETRSFREQ